MPTQIPGAWPEDSDDISDDEELTVAQNESDRSPKSDFSGSTATTGSDGLPSILGRSNIPPIVTPITG